MTTLSEPVAKRALRAGYRALVGARTAASALLAPRSRGLAVHYGGARVGDVGGPLVKVARLSAHFPDTPWGFDLLYLLSNAPYVPRPALSLVKARGVPIVVNQNGVFYPAWYSGDWRGENARMAAAYHAADWVFWQSEFCRRSADRFLGARAGGGEVLYNAVDTTRFVPAREGARGKGEPVRFLVTGKIGDHLVYRLERSIEGLAEARRAGLDARLVVAGWVEEGALTRARAVAEAAGVGPHVAFTGAYTQREAPAIYAAADAYVMLKHQDPCPNTVLEALACGLPVLYSASGGVPELVGEAAGIGLPCAEDWDAPRVPDAAAIGAGMVAIAERLSETGAAARARAVERFDIAHWIGRHRAVFERLLAER